MAQTQSGGPAKGAAGSGPKKDERQLNVNDVLGKMTGSTVAALAHARTQKVTTAFQKQDWPGAQHRQYNRWFIKAGRDVQTLIIAAPPGFILGYRSVVAARMTNGRAWPDIALHQSPSQYNQIINGVVQKQFRSNVVDKYFETWGKPDEWMVVTALCRRPKYDDHNNVIGTQEQYVFIELEPGSPILEELQKTEQLKYFLDRAAEYKVRIQNENAARRKLGQPPLYAPLEAHPLTGVVFEVSRVGERSSNTGVWRLKTITDKKSGMLVPEYFAPDKLVAYLKQQATKKVKNKDGSKDVPAMYVSSVDEAYPLASPDQQGMVLSAHFQFLQDHPDWAGRFPNTLVAVNQSSATAEQGGQEISLDSIDALNGTGSAPTDDGTSISLDSPAETEEVPSGVDTVENAPNVDEPETNEESTEEEVEAVEEYTLEDGTPCDKDGNILAPSGDAVVEEEPAPGEEGEPEEDGAASTEDGQQDAGIADLKGDVSAFGHTDLNKLVDTKPQTQKGKKKAAAAPAAPTPAPAIKKPVAAAKPVAKVEPPKAEKTVVKAAPAPAAKTVVAPPKPVVKHTVVKSK